MSRRFASPLVTALAATAAACGGGGNGTADAPVSVDDSAVDSPPKHIVSVTSFGTPAIFEFKDGSGAWQDVPTPNQNDQSTIPVTNDFVIFMLCTGTGTNFDATMVAATVADGDQFIDCFVDDDTGTPPTFAVTGTMQQAGNIQMDDTTSGGTSPWSFTLNVPTGVYDLAAFDTAMQHMLIRRDINVGSAASAITPALDLTTEGAAIASVAPIITGLGSGDSFLVDTSLFADATSFDLGADFGSGSGSATAPPGVLLPPPSLLAANDLLEVQINAFTNTTEQSAFLDGEGPAEVAIPDPVAMLPVLTGVTFTNGAGTVASQWTTLPAGSDETVELFVENSVGGSQSISATPGWLALHGDTTLAFDTTAKGFKTIWDIDTTQVFFASLLVNSFDEASSTSYSSSFTDPAGEALRATAVRHQRALRRRHAVHAAHTAHVIGASRKILP